MKRSARINRSDPGEAIRLWQWLAAGRRSLVDSFDSDGRRYLVAHRNDPDLAAPNALTLSERQIAGYAAMGHANKLIAYELGLSESTVATHLGSAVIKLGVRSRADLARLFAGTIG
jgi:DNA-binding NarL/FixJ family response regulator